MRKEKRDVYLSELFLEELGGRFSREAVLQALEGCNDEMLQRLGSHHDVGELINFLLMSGDRGQGVSDEIKQEFLDFWDVYGEFDELVGQEVKEEYLVLRGV